MSNLLIKHENAALVLILPNGVISALLNGADVPPLVIVSINVPMEVVPVHDDPESQISLADIGGQSDRRVAYTQHSGRSVTVTICSAEVSRTSTCRS